MYKGYLIDLDGTIYKGKLPIDGAKEFIEQLQEKQVPFLFLTNNTTKTSAEVATNLQDNFSIHVTSDKVYTASLATVDYMNEVGREKTVYVLGEKGLVDTILAAGYTWEENHSAYVVVGLDRQLDYEKITKASLAIQKGALFIGTNPDRRIPTERGLLPGAGALLALLETATGEAPIIIGKPEATIMENALSHIGLAKNEVLMIGDNYETDICAGINYGIDTLLVLTGFTQKEQVEKLPIAPTYVLNNLSGWQI